MTRKQIIQKLEGRTITTADNTDHIVRDSKFTTRTKAVVKLESLHTYHLQGFLDHAT